MPRLLIISPHFPPINAPDMQRVRMSLPYYRENGWEPIVLAVDPETDGGTHEEELKKTIPPDIRIHRIHAIPLKRARMFGVGNLGLRAWWSLFRAGLKIIREDKIDLVFISNTQFVTFTLGRLWRRLTGVPYVIDLQDPWRTDYYKGARKKERPGGWKYEAARLQSVFLERWSLRRMSAFMSVSPGYLDALRHRYAWLANIPSEVIVFGASDNDLAVARQTRVTTTTREMSDTRVISTGAAGPIMHAALQVLFDGLVSFQTKANLQFEFYGTSYAPGDSVQLSVLPLARSAGVATHVSEIPTRLGLLEIMRVQASASALLLLGSTDPAYTASKLHQYFLSGRPMLAIVLRGSRLEQQLSELSCATIIAFDTSGPSAETRSQIHAFFAAALDHFPTVTLPIRNEELFRREFLAPALTAHQCALFEAALTHHQQ
jgi:hypothetical protein